MKKRLIVTCGASFLLLGMLATQAPTSHAASAVHYVRGYSIQGSWLCYGWPRYYHCTQKWRWENGSAVSLTSFVPNGLPGRVSHSAPARPQTGTAVSALRGSPCDGRAIVWPAHISQWTVPSGCYAGIYRPNPANYVSRPSYGYCNWWPEVLSPGYAGSAVLHLASHSAPRIGATVFFAGGVQGASRDGHYARVVAIAPGGYWVLITEMNFTWRGGGFAKVDYRYIHVGAGVSFRY